jgi:hypothetical protein
MRIRILRHVLVQARDAANAARSARWLGDRPSAPRPCNKGRSMNTTHRERMSDTASQRGLTRWGLVAWLVLVLLPAAASCSGGRHFEQSVLIEDAAMLGEDASTPDRTATGDPASNANDATDPKADDKNAAANSDKPADKGDSAQPKADDAGAGKPGLDASLAPDATSAQPVSDAGAQQPTAAGDDCRRAFEQCTLNSPTEYASKCIPQAEKCGLFAPDAGLQCSVDYASCLTLDPLGWSACVKIAEKCGLAPNGAAACASEFDVCFAADPTKIESCVVQAEKCGLIPMGTTACSSELQRCVSQNPDKLQPCFETASQCGVLATVPNISCATQYQQCVLSNPAGVDACLKVATECGLVPAVPSTSCATEFQQCVLSDPSKVAQCLQAASQCGLIPGVTL